MSEEEQSLEELDALAADEAKELEKGLEQIRLEVAKGIVEPNQSDEDQQFVIGLVKCLSAERADNFDSWIRVGWCLHNINIFYLPLWKDFSKQSSKYEEEYCDNEWNNMHRDGLHLGSLRLWAREDNPEEFKKIINKRTHILLEKCTEFVSIKPPSVNCTIQLAKYIKEKYGPRFVCAAYGKDLWYEFKDHKWKESDKEEEGYCVNTCSTYSNYSITTYD